MLEKSLVLGNDYYTNEKTRAASLEKGESALGVGAPPRLHLGKLGRWLSDGIFGTQSSAMLSGCTGANPACSTALMDHHTSQWG